MNVVRGLLVAIALLWNGATAAQQVNYPSKPIRLIVAYAAGSSADLLARAMEPVLSERLRQQIIIENRPGAAGNAGIDAVAKSAPDGYTLGLGAAGALAANVSLYPNMPYDPAKDLAPVSTIAFIPLVLIANPKLPATSLAELVELARAKPGELLIGFGGNGTTMNLASELFKLTANIQLVNVPYKDTAPVVQDAANGKLAVGISDLGSALPAIKSGKVRALAVTSARRVSVAPDVPTFAEAGLAGYEATGWFGLVVAAATPPAIVGRLNADIVATLKRAEVRDRMIAAGIEPAPSTPEEFSAMMRAEIAKWANVVRISGARPD
ncbi:MAG: Bug family tripartite tricarboxylate transporter substrate binding protein [Burkholderiales bacterium]